MTSLFGFRLLNILLTFACIYQLVSYVQFVASFRDALDRNQSDYFTLGVKTFLLIVFFMELILRFLAAHTLKPFFAQIYWIHLVFWGTLLASFNLFVLFMLFTSPNKLPDFILNILLILYSKESKIEERREITVNDLIINMVVLSVYFIWMFQLTYSFYTYVRDLQMEKDERWETRIVNAERKIEETPPPAYTEL
ncbi:unnamed protein product, partial [Mesorhabditis belari]|uniref:Uncharacterized protein n=1 Tax=Mesorhabditis belari TaxID=2138241 RepID=A0AAF3FIN9_9BILA